MSARFPLARRALLKGGLAAPLAMSAVARAAALPALVLVDSSLGHAVEPGMLDLAGERRRNWSTIRSGLGDVGRVTGLLRWSDHVMIVHELQRQGFRRAAIVREGRLWRMDMVREGKR